MAVVVPIITELYYSFAWNDISSKVYTRDKITIKRGAQNEGSQSDPSECTLTINNRDGRFSPRNPTSPLYGLIGRNTPIRVRAPNGPVALHCNNVANNFASTPDNAALDVLGDIDLRAEIRVDGTTAIQMILAKGIISTNLAYALAYTRSGFGVPQITLYWSTTGTNLIQIDHPMPGLLVGRTAVRATLDVDDGAGHYVATFYTSDSINGTWTQHGSTTVGGSTTSIFNSSAALNVGDHFSTSMFVGNIYAVRVLNGIAGTAVANPDFYLKASGTTSFTDAAGRVWTVGAGAAITDMDDRFRGEVAAWPVSWDQSGSDVYVQIQAAGIQRRLGQGQPAKITAYKAYVKSTNPYRYFPFDDPVGATFGLPDGASAALGAPYAFRSSASTNSYTFGTGNLGQNLPKGLEIRKSGTAAPSNGYTSSGFFAGFVGYGGSGQVCIDVLFMSSNLQPLQIRNGDYSSKNGQWDCYLRADTTHDDVQLIVWQNDPDTGPSSTVIATSAGLLAAFRDGALHHLRFTMTQSGSDTNVAAFLDGVSVVSGTATGALVTGISNVQAFYNGTDSTNTVALGHLAVYTAGGQPTTAAVLGQLSSHLGEAAGTRIARLCSDNATSFMSKGDLTDTAGMGPQAAGAVLDLIREAATADLGMIYEPRDSISVGYRTRKNLYNQTAKVTLDYSQAVLSAAPNPTDDDLNVHNDVTVSNWTGTSAEDVLTSGALSTAAPPSGINTYPTSYTQNHETDAPLPDHASWRLALGTVDEARYPQLPVNLVSNELRANSALTSAVVLADVGDRATLTALPAWLPPDNVEQLILGYTEDLWQFGWDIVFNCAPYSPFLVAVYGTDRYDAESSDLAAGVNTVAASLSVGSAANTALWTTDGAAVPFDINIGGERITVTAISGSSSPQTFTVTRSVNGVVKSHSIHETVRLWKTPRYAL